LQKLPIRRWIDRAVEDLEAVAIPVIVSEAFTVLRITLRLLCCLKVILYNAT
jgi:hypothetical protein